MNKIIYYLPRILTIAMVLFFGIFILEGFALVQIFLTLVILGITVAAWKWPKIGGCFLILLGLFFTQFFHPLLWNGLIIGGVPLLSGCLFLAEDKKLKNYYGSTKQNNFNQRRGYGDRGGYGFAVFGGGLAGGGI